MLENTQEVDIDKIIEKLVGSKGKEVKLLEAEIRGLCVKAREIFQSQPMLLELEAPIKICGNLTLIQEMFMVSSLIYSDCSNMADSHQMLTICSWETISIVENSRLRQCLCCWLTKSSILRTFSF